MRDVDAFEAAYGKLASTKLVTGLRGQEPEPAKLREGPGGVAARSQQPRSRLLARLDTMAPKARPARRNWRFTD